MNIVVTNKPSPTPRLDQLGVSAASPNEIQRTLEGVSASTQKDLSRLDLTRVRPSELRGVVVQLHEAGKLSMDAASKLLNVRSRATQRPSDDTPFNLFDRLEKIDRVVRSLPPTDPCAAQRPLYAASIYSARGMEIAIKALRTGVLLDLKA